MVLRRDEMNRKNRIMVIVVVDTSIVVMDVRFTDDDNGFTVFIIIVFRLRSMNGRFVAVSVAMSQSIVV